MCVRTSRWRRKEQGGWWCRPEVSSKREFKGQMRCGKQKRITSYPQEGLGVFTPLFLDTDVSICVNDRSVSYRRANIPE